MIIQSKTDLIVMIFCSLIFAAAFLLVIFKIDQNTKRHYEENSRSIFSYYTIGYIDGFAWKPFSVPSDRADLERKIKELEKTNPKLFDSLRKYFLLDNKNAQ